MNVFQYFVLAALVVFASAQFQDSCPDDTYTKISQCYSTYFAGYNLTMNPNIPEYWDFHYIRKQMLDDDGLHIQPYICQLGNALSDCLSPYSCMGPNAFLKMGAANATEAIDYQIDLAVTQYQCGVGYNLTMTEFYCIAFCRDRYQPDLDACDAQSAVDVKNGMDQCAATQKDFNCQSNIYKTCCDFNAGVYICNVNLAGLNSVNPACSNAGQSHAQSAVDVKNGMDKCAATQKDFNCQSNIYKTCCDFNAGVYICNVNLAGLNSVNPACSNAGQVSCPAPR